MRAGTNNSTPAASERLNGGCEPLIGAKEAAAILDSSPTKIKRKMLRHLGVDLKVQQELLRHADIRTTMNTYTQAMPTALHEANSKAVRMVIQ